jgi:hypothetical protein
MENKGYFSQTFINNCDEPKYETTKQILHVRAVDCMNLNLDHLNAPDLSLNTPIEFNVQFSNGSLNKKNTLSLTNVYNSDGSIIDYGGAFNNVQNVIGIPPYQEVSKVELKGVSFPFIRNNDQNVNASDLDVPDPEPSTDYDYRKNGGDAFFAIDIPEFKGRVHSTTNKLHDIFAIMYYDSTTPDSGTIKPIRGVDFDSKTYIPKSPIKRLNKFKVRFLNSNGNVVKLGDFNKTFIRYNEDNDKENALKHCIKTLYQVSLLFEFTIRL